MARCPSSSTRAYLGSRERSDVGLYDPEGHAAHPRAVDKPHVAGRPPQGCDCSGCFRLELLAGGACTCWKALPLHGPHVERILRVAEWTSQFGDSALRA